MYATALAACCLETDALLPVHGHSRTVQAVRACRTPSPACSADEGNNLQAEAERLALLAERASLEAEALEMEAETIRAAKRAAEPEPPPPPPAIDDAGPMALSAPLRWIGPYPAVALSFPALASPAQKARLLTNPNQAANLGVTLDFVIDTAANTNTISAQVAGPTGAGGLELQQVGRVEGGVGAGGAIGGGATYMLGGCELADLPKAERVMFMSDLTATALPVAAPAATTPLQPLADPNPNPTPIPKPILSVSLNLSYPSPHPRQAAAGLLGVPFLDSFGGGVEFCWGPPPPAAAADGAVAAATTTTAAAAAVGAEAEAPSLTFYADARGTGPLRARLSGHPLTRLPESALPRVTLVVNGVAIPALLDTGGHDENTPI